MKIRELIRAATLDLEAAGRLSPRLDAEMLLAHCLKKDRLHLFMNPDLPLTEGEANRFLQLAARRRQGEPVAYIIGRKPFWTAVFEVNGNVLIPRPETEFLVDECLKVRAGPEAARVRILELGTGSGAIGVSLALELKNARLVATDISPEAVAVARRNARRCGVEERMVFLAGNLLDPLRGKFDMIVSNPPYIPEGAFDTLPVEVRGYEPPAALTAGPDGLLFHRSIIARGVDHLEDGGWLLLEIGAEQKEGVEALFQGTGAFEQIRFRRDYAGLHRVAAARKRGQGSG